MASESQTKRKMPTVPKISETFFRFMYYLAIFLSLKDGVVLAQSDFNLPEEEKNALREIAVKLGKHDWDFSLNPCDGNTNWTTPKTNSMPTYYVNNVSCTNSSDGLYHVETILLKGQDLAGVLPPSLAKLPYLKTIDLTRNYLSGTIPPEWASTKLENIYLLANRFSGPIPKYLGNITTLVYLSLECNQFNGTVPSELGKLINLQNLTLSDNNLTGALPKELSNLKKLVELRLSSNHFTGKIPSFQIWTNLIKLEIQASGFEAPIPSSISQLKNLSELKISDVNGGSSDFPMLGEMTRMTRLMLRSCNISGTIPNYIANMSDLQMLDLSFNNLEGGIPNLEGLERLEFMYLTGNRLSGPIQDWTTNKGAKHQFDLSYNNFSESSVPSTCRETLNLFRSYNAGNTLELAKCLNVSCSKVSYSFHINCGGGEATIGDRRFEADDESSGPAKFVSPTSSKTWGMSNTGDFWYRSDTSPNYYVAHNVSVLRINDSVLYETARLSPLSLTYFGRCLANGNYTVTLHFAEIVFRDNRSFQSLGRRMFDVYIQGEQKLKDFNIKNEAKGVDKAVIRKFNATVKNTALEIRFQFSGKGSTAIPVRGTYGPLVSAISVESDFKPPTNKRRKIFIGTGAGLLAMFLLIVVICGFWWKGNRRRIAMEKELKGLDLRTSLFTLSQIQAATNNFDAANKIGEGGFGSVYKGTLLDGTIIAVKQLSSKSKQGNREFVNEIGMISGLQHPNLVKLYGCCTEGNHLLLVYEYMENNSLARALFGPVEWQLELDWPTRQKICLGIAQGLAFLHEESTLKIVHRDIKTNNVLLDKDLNPKISDFGLAKLDEEENSHITTRVAGTVGYMAPEYALWGHLTYKADVYSFGIVTLEILAGKNNMKYRPGDNFVCLLDWALVLQKKGRLMELVDPRLLPTLSTNEDAENMIKLALLCTNPAPALRPVMSEVVSMLQGHVSVQEFSTDPSLYTTELKLQALKEKYDDSSETVVLVNSSDPTSSKSVPDLGSK